jgi:hypothetical protein
MTEEKEKAPARNCIRCRRFFCRLATGGGKTSGDTVGLHGCLLVGQDAEGAAGPGTTEENEPRLSILRVVAKCRRMVRLPLQESPGTGQAPALKLGGLGT